MITPTDLQGLVDAAVDALYQRVDREWNVPSGTTTFTCWETLEHLGEGLFFYATQLVPVPERLGRGYPFDFEVRREGGHEGSLFAHPDQGNLGVLRILTQCGGLMVALLRTAPSELRAQHGWGLADPQGYAAMAVVETAIHIADIAGALDLDWRPDADLCRRTLDRLFPDAPTDTEPWSTLRWATGRGELPGRARLTDWRWYADVR